VQINDRSTTTKSKTSDMIVKQDSQQMAWYWQAFATWKSLVHC